MRQELQKQDFQAASLWARTITNPDLQKQALAEVSQSQDPSHAARVEAFLNQNNLNEAVTAPSPKGEGF